jgi:RNA polymerase sigma factor (TIGR02999 family)
MTQDAHDEPSDVTQLLNAWGNGRQEALDELMPIVYQELRKLARGYLRSERNEHTLQPTALVNEAYLRLVDQKNVRWQNRSHFFGIASQLMRRILVDHARKRQSEKRGGGEVPLPFDEAKGVPTKPRDLVALDDALTDFATLDPRAAKIVELRQFGGLSIDETAEILEISPATVKREWTAAKAWLRRATLQGEQGG